jgi:hypothetical protein
VEGAHPDRIPDSILATVLFTDLVGSTQRAAALGDRGWRDLLTRHHEDVRRDLARFRGISVVTGARVAALGDSGEVLVSHTVKDLVAGSGSISSIAESTNLRASRVPGAYTPSPKADEGRRLPASTTLPAALNLACASVREWPPTI